MQSLNESRKRQRLRSSCLRAIFPLIPWSINLDVVMTLILTLHSKLQLIPDMFLGFNVCRGVHHSLSNPEECSEVLLQRSRENHCSVVKRKGQHAGLWHINNVSRFWTRTDIISWAGSFIFISWMVETTVLWKQLRNSLFIYPADSKYKMRPFTGGMFLCLDIEILK